MRSEDDDGTVHEWYEQRDTRKKNNVSVALQLARLQTLRKHFQLLRPMPQKTEASRRLAEHKAERKQARTDELMEGTKQVASFKIPKRKA